ncbi:MAG: hypothetical protein JF614_25130 [Acidobacteria bacterium]|nr:hypothetical protein [Acidobacteriota bacterium]
MMRKIATLVLWSTFGACTIVPNAPHRLQLDNGSWRPWPDSRETFTLPDKGPVDNAYWAPLARTSLEHFDTFDVGVIEFKDSGELWSPAQRDLVLSHVKRLAEHGGATIVVFIHGWHHSAAPADGNIVSFRRILKTLSAQDIGMRCQDDDRPKPNRVVGIYVGWRGESIGNEPLNLTTIWQRKKVAQRIGGWPQRAEAERIQQGKQQEGQLADLLKRLDKIQKDANASLQNENTFTSLIAVGHSLGGAMLLSAMDRIVLEGKDELTCGEAVPRIGDLAILLNPAAEALRYKGFNRSLNCQFTAEQAPVLLTLSSRGDTANRAAFTFSRILATLVIPPYWPDFPSSLFTVGFRRTMRTHELSVPDENSKPEITYYRSDLSPSMTDVKRFDMAAAGRYGTTRLKPKGNRHPNATEPFMVVYATRDIIRDHNDIFSDRVVEFLLPFVTSVERKNILHLCSQRQDKEASGGAK